MLAVAATQCAKGAVNLGKYAVGSELLQAGVIGAGDMTTEAAATKLAYLFGRVESAARVAELMRVDLRGELTTAEADGEHAATRRRGLDPVLARAAASKL